MGQQPRSFRDAWELLMGHLAEMIHDGSEDAASILRIAHELRPSTRIFTGEVDELIAKRRRKPGCN
jgi:hypothetical protein